MFTKESVAYWKNQVHVEYDGAEKVSQLRYDFRAPKQTNKPKILMPAVKFPEENLLSRTFMHGVTTPQILT